MCDLKMVTQMCNTIHLSELFTRVESCWICNKSTYMSS